MTTTEGHGNAGARKHGNMFLVSCLPRTMLVLALSFLFLAPIQPVLAACTEDSDCASSERCVLLPGRDASECYATGGTTVSEESAATQGLAGAKGFVTNFFAPKTGFNVGAARPEIVAGKIIQGALGLIGVIFGILVIYGGYLWMIARGNEEDVKKSIEILKTAITGFIIVIAAYAITSFIVNQVITAAFQ